MTLMVHTLGMMREQAKVLTALRKAGIKAALTDPTPWLRLDEVRRRWEHETALRFRDRIAFHLCCSTEDAVRGLELLQRRTDQVTLCEAAKPALLEARFPVGDELVFAAAALEEADVTAVVKWTPEDSAQMTQDLQSVALDLLKQCGARI
jgi:hypothetical protein